MADLVLIHDCGHKFANDAVCGNCHTEVQPGSYSVFDPRKEPSDRTPLPAEVAYYESIREFPEAVKPRPRHKGKLGR